MIWVNFWVREAKPPHHLWHSSQRLHWYLFTLLIPRRLGRLRAWAYHNGRFRGFDTSRTLGTIPTFEALNRQNASLAALCHYKNSPMSKRQYRDYLRRIGVDPHHVESAW